MSGPLFRRAAGAPEKDSNAMTPADVYHTARIQHGDETANRVKTTLDFLNGGPIDLTDTMTARKQKAQK